MSETASADSGPQASALPPGTRLGEYELRQVVGVGGFGIVYLAVDHGLEREVAIKEYMPSSIAARTATQQVSVVSQSSAETFALGLRSFVNEARLLARFDHPSLIKVHRFWEERGTAYMVMPLLRGRTLRDVRLAMSNAPDEAWLRSVLDPLLGALEVLHREDVFHRDIAPDNILIGDDGVPILLDFGAARRVLSGRSQNLTAILKPSYAPIEQYGESPSLRQGAWTDLYALGATLHFLVTGSPPAPATVRTVHDETPRLAARPCPGVGRRFLEVVDWMLETRPGDRPQSVAEVREALSGRRPAGSGVAADLEDRTLVMPARPAREASDDDATVVQLGRASAAPPTTSGAPATDVARPVQSRRMAAAPAAAGSSEGTVRAAPIGDRGAAAQSSASPNRSAGPWVGAVAVLLVAGAAALWFFGRSASAPAAVQPPVHSTSADATAPTAPATIAVTAGTPAASSQATAQPALAVPSMVPAGSSPGDPAPAAHTPVSASPSAPPAARPSPATAGTTRPSVQTTNAATRGAGAADARTGAARPGAAERRVTSSSVEAAGGDRRTDAPADASTVAAPRAAPPREQAASAVKPTPAARSPEPVAEVPRSPREQCGNRLLLALHSCLVRECVKPEYRSHSDCQRVREIEERAGRPMP